MSPDVYIPLVIICGIFLLSELLCRLVKEKVDSLLFFMLLLIVFGSMLGLVDEEAFDKSLFSTITYGFGLPFAIISFGATISIKDFKGQCATVILSVLTIVAIMLVGAAAGTPIFGLRLALYSSVEMAGGGQAGLIFLARAKEIGDSGLEALIVLLMNVKICIGYPLSVFALRRGIAGHLRAGDVQKLCSGTLAGAEVTQSADTRPVKLPDFLANSFYYVFVVFGLCALTAYYLQSLTTISHYVWEIVLGFLAAQLGLLEKNALHRVGAGGLIFAAMYAVICSSMCNLALSDILLLLPQVLFYLLVGVLGSALCALVMCRIVKKNFWETFAVALGCMVGFPASLKVAQSAVAPLAAEKQLDDKTVHGIIAYYEPQMVISGVVTISLLTGIIAGVIVGYI